MLIATSSDWLDAEVMPALISFFKPLLAWIMISIVAPLVRYRLDKQLWLYNKKHRATHSEPKFKKYRNTIMNCLLIVLLAAICKLSVGATVGVSVTSNVIMIIFAAVQVVKCMNTYLKLEEVGFRINIYKMFSKSSFVDALEADSDDPCVKTNNENNAGEKEL